MAREYSNRLQQYIRPVSLPFRQNLQYSGQSTRTIYDGNLNIWGKYISKNLLNVYLIPEFNDYF